MSIAEQTKEYIVSRPAIHECLRRGVINFSALAREIEKFYGVQNTPAIVAAASRYASRLKRVPSHDKQVDRALKNAKLTFRSDMMLYVLERPLSEILVERLLQTFRVKGAGFNFVEGEQRAIVTIHAEFQSEISTFLKDSILEIFDRLILITITQSRKVMRTPGVAARLYGLLAENGIPPVESLLVGGEHLLYINEEDLVRVMELIQSGYIGSSRTYR